MLVTPVRSPPMHEPSTVTSPTAIAVPSTDGVTVVAHDHGGDGSPLMFCHATGLHGRYWDPVCAELADEFRCIAIDLRGHGDSRFPAGLDFDWRGMAEDLLAVIDHFGLSSVDGVGHSMGGCTVIRAEIMRPGTIGKGWLCEPIVMAPDTGFGSDVGENPLADSARRRREVFESRDAAFERYASRPPFDRTDPVALRAYVDHGFRDQADGTVILKCRGEVEAQVFEHSHTDVWEHLPEVEATLTVAGSADGERPAAIAPMIADRLPRGRFEFLDGLTHFAPLEDPTRIAASIRAAVQ